ncbi:hypothetical protein MEX01_51470 [Methylorubrum extorquens]|nr:hypothetical protein MEX01_51470 [Methylorubrum extorquens]
MMVKDEDDIIYENLAWHYQIGFKCFLIINNGSTDNTRAEINRFIKDFSEKGARVVVVDDYEEAYYQAAKTTAGSKFAKIYFGCNWIFALDADEFLDFGRRKLVDVITYVERQMSDLLQCSSNSGLYAAAVRMPLRNYVCTPEDDVTDRSPTRRMVFRHRQGDGRKVAVRLTEDVYIAQGNHHARLNDGTTLPSIDGASIGLSIRHYRVRSFDHFMSKVKNGGIAYERATKLAPQVGTHWREYYEILKNKGRDGLYNLYSDKFCHQIDNLVFDPLPDLHGMSSGADSDSLKPARFRRIHIGRQSPDYLLVEGQKLKPYSFAVIIEGFPRPIELRMGTSDLPTYYQVFKRFDYDIPLPFIPETIVDLGANIGLAAVYFHVRWPSARIVAVEPDPANARQLRRNFGELPQVEILQAAVWFEDSKLFLVDKDKKGNDLDFWGRQITSSEVEKSAREIAIDAVTIPSVIDRFDLKRIDLLKIDIEGAELELFSHNADQWLKCVRAVFVETHDRFRPGSDAAVRTTLLRAGFTEAPRRGENLVFINSN